MTRRRTGVPSLSSRLYNIVVALDQTGNACGGGNADTTISGRCYYNAWAHGGLFWKGFQAFVNFCFWGLDGPHHCEQAYFNDSGEEYHDANYFDRVILLILSIPVCVVVAPFGYLIALIKFLRR